jgi:hypothetical protein
MATRKQAKAFVRGIEKAIEDSPKFNRCDQCEALVINGFYCHETGCPNTHKVFRNGEWIPVRECKECGCEVYGDASCCES